MIFVADIMRATAQHYGLPLEAMNEADWLGTRKREKARPRQLAMCLSLRLTQQTTKSIGRRFHRDHSTIIAGNKAAEARIAADDELKAIARKITKQLLFQPRLQV